MERNHQPDYFTQLLRNLLDKVTSDLAGPFLAKITRLDKDKGVGDLQPLGMPDGEKLPMIENASFIIQPLYYEMGKVPPEHTADMYEIDKPQLDYMVGDEVLVIVLKYDNQNYSKGNFNVDSSRTFENDFAYILGRHAKPDDFRKD